MHNWDADDYRKHSEVQLKWGRELINKLTLKDDARVLDIGCGDGKVTAEIAASVPRGRVIGIDSSAEMIRVAAESFPRERCANLEFRLMDARELRFNEEFDIVFSNAVLHWIKDHRTVLGGIAACLKHHGRILLQMGGTGNVRDMLIVMTGLTVDAKWKQYFIDFESPYSFYSPEEYKVWLKEAKLRPFRVELIPKDMTQHGRDGLTAWVRTTWHPFLDRLPDALRQEFLDSAVDNYLLKHPLEADGLAHVAAVRLEVEAEKI